MKKKTKTEKKNRGLEHISVVCIVTYEKLGNE